MPERVCETPASAVQQHAPPPRKRARTATLSSARNLAPVFELEHLAGQLDELRARAMARALDGDQTVPDVMLEDLPAYVRAVTGPGAVPVARAVVGYYRSHLG